MSSRLILNSSQRFFIKIYKLILNYKKWFLLNNIIATLFNSYKCDYLIDTYLITTHFL